MQQVGFASYDPQFFDSFFPQHSFRRTRAIIEMRHKARSRKTLPTSNKVSAALDNSKVRKIHRSICVRPIPLSGEGVDINRQKPNRDEHGYFSIGSFICET
jgi:hypothetical protein